MTWTSDCGTVRLYCGDCLDVLPTLEAGSVDAVVTDPPYGLSFMGKHWDHGIPGEQFWREVIRVAKPGCHLLAFGGTRTYHRLVVAIEDAGWEVRDCLGWIYGSGFPKSLDVSKAIDQRERGQMVREKLMYFAKVRGIDGKWLEAHGVASASSFSDWTVGGHVPSGKNWELVKVALGVTPEEEAAFEREVVGRSENGIAGGTGEHAGQAASYGFAGEYDITAPATEAAKQWQGWGTALKPAWEPIILARKPLVGTVAANVLEHGTGGLNVDGCRVPHDGDCLRGGGVGSSADGWDRPWKRNEEMRAAHKAKQAINAEHAEKMGRWPANIVHDGSGEVLDVLGEQSRFFYSAKASKVDRDEGCEGLAERLPVDGADKWTEQDRRRGEGVTRHPSRNHHPTVKPTDLMRWLVRLVTPPGGAVLDPFMGSGSTGKAARLEGFRFVGIEREAEYHEIAKRRIEAELKRFPLFERAERQKQGELFQ